MSVRSLAVLGVVTATLVSAMPALASDGFVVLNNEAGYQFVGTPGVKTRDEVRRELLATPSPVWRLTEASPPPMAFERRAGFTVTREEARQAAELAAQSRPADGWRNLGGEAGWVFDK